MGLSLAGSQYMLQSGAMHLQHHRGITEALIHAIDRPARRHSSRYDGTSGRGRRTSLPRHPALSLIYKRQATDLQQMSDLPEPLRQRLRERLYGVA